MAAKIVGLLLRIVIGGLFLYAGGIKALDLQQFTIDVHHYQLTTGDLTIAIATYLPWLEIVSGLGLLAKRLYLGALTAIFGMTVVFLGAIGSAWQRGLDISCGCFGREENATNFPLHIGGNVAVLVALGILFAAEWRGRRIAEK